MPVIEYAKPELARRAPLLGRISAGCIIPFVAIYAILVYTQPDPPFNWITAIFMLGALSTVGIVLGLIAVIRRSKRTRLAWFAMMLWAAWWLFYAFALFMRFMTENSN